MSYNDWEDYVDSISERYPIKEWITFMNFLSESEEHREELNQVDGIISDADGWIAERNETVGDIEYNQQQIQNIQDEIEELESSIEGLDSDLDGCAEELDALWERVWEAIRNQEIPF